MTGRAAIVLVVVGAAAALGASPDEAPGSLSQLKALPAFKNVPKLEALHAEALKGLGQYRLLVTQENVDQLGLRTTAEADKAELGTPNARLPCPSGQTRGLQALGRPGNASHRYTDRPVPARGRERHACDGVHGLRRGPVEALVRGGRESIEAPRGRGPRVRAELAAVGERSLLGSSPRVEPGIRGYAGRAERRAADSLGGRRSMGAEGRHRGASGEGVRPAGAFGKVPRPPAALTGSKSAESPGRVARETNAASG